MKYTILVLIFVLCGCEFDKKKKSKPDGPFKNPDQGEVGTINLEGNRKGYTTTSGGFFEVINTYGLNIAEDVDDISFVGMTSYKDDIYILFNRADDSGLKWKDIYKSNVDSTEWLKVCSINDDNNFSSSGISVDQDYFYIASRRSTIRTFNFRCDEVNSIYVGNNFNFENLSVQENVFYFNNTELVEFERSSGAISSKIDVQYRAGIKYWWHYQNMGYVVGKDVAFGIRSHDTKWSIWLIYKDGRESEWGMLPHEDYFQFKGIKHITYIEKQNIIIITSVRNDMLYFVFVDVSNF